MRKLTTVALSILAGGVLVSSTFADTQTAAKPAQAGVVQAAPAAQDNIADASYTIGYSIGKNMTEQLKQQDIALNTSDLQQGFVAGIEGSQPKLSQEQMEQTMQAFQKEMEAKMKAHEEATQAETAKTKSSQDADKANANTAGTSTSTDNAEKAVTATSTTAN